MVHIVFNRPTSTFKVFDAGALRFSFDANGSAWGDNGPNAPYGYQCQIAPGHYRLWKVEEINPPINSEGPGQIYVCDLKADAAESVGGVQHDDGTFTIGQLSGAIGLLDKYQRTEVMVHGGGSNAPDPLADRQQLCRTYGCTRLHNADLKQLMAYLTPRIKSAIVVVYTVIGDSPELPS